MTKKAALLKYSHDIIHRFNGATKKSYRWKYGIHQPGIVAEARESADVLYQLLAGSHGCLLGICMHAFFLLVGGILQRYVCSKGARSCVDFKEKGSMHRNEVTTSEGKGGET